jgi:sex pheromone cAD1
MKIKRLFPVFMIFALTSCEDLPFQDKTTYKDGTYVATYDQFDYNHGKAVLKFTLTNDEIKDVDFDYLNLKGDLLSMGADMPCFPVDPNTFLPNVENAIANATIVPAYNEIGVIAQANKETEDANVLANAIFTAATEGNTDTIYLQQTYLIAYINGAYRAEYDEFDRHGWKAFLQFDLNDDVISNVDFDYINSDGDRKSEDQVYNERMYGLIGITKPEWYVVEIETRIANTAICVGYDSYQVDVVTGATGSSNDAFILFNAAMTVVKEEISDTAIVSQIN